MATEKRLIDAKGKFTLNAEDITGHIMCVENGYATVFDRFAKVICKFDLLDVPTVDAVEVVHSRFVRIADFGDGEGCFGHCEKCGTVHHSQSPVALKADYRWCRWCGAKMDGDGNA
jgi:hypothetical protein